MQLYTPLNLLLLIPTLVSLVIIAQDWGLYVIFCSDFDLQPANKNAGSNTNKMELKKGRHNINGAFFFSNLSAYFVTQTQLLILQKKERMLQH
jgi:hypothetical protein